MLKSILKITKSIPSAIGGILIGASLNIILSKRLRRPLLRAMKKRKNAMLVTGSGLILIGYQGLENLYKSRIRLPYKKLNTYGKNTFFQGINKR